jgi:hypothetical protein
VSVFSRDLLFYFLIKKKDKKDKNIKKYQIYAILGYWTYNVQLKKVDILAFCLEKYTHSRFVSLNVFLNGCKILIVTRETNPPRNSNTQGEKYEKVIVTYPRCSYATLNTYAHVL